MTVVKSVMVKVVVIIVVMITVLVMVLCDIGKHDGEGDDDGGGGNDGDYGDYGGGDDGGGYYYSDSEVGCHFNKIPLSNSQEKPNHPLQASCDHAIDFDVLLLDCSNIHE